MRKVLIIALLTLSGMAQAQSLWDHEHLKNVKEQIDRPFYAMCYQQLMKRAEKDLMEEPLTVMMKEHTPASGTKHDYESLSRYYWPDPTKANGLPYISRDGESNPELDKFDRNKLGAMASRVTRLSLAWYFSGEEKYAQKATELIRVWFFNKDTYMKPNLDYAQMIPGVNGGKGRKSGLIDGYSFVDMLEGVALLETSKSFTSKDSKKLKDWFGKFLQWYLTSEQGIGEGNAQNNHAVAYDTQVIAYALYSGNMDVAKKVINAVPERRLFTQIEPDGRQPQELRRTLAFGYSEYNLTHFIDIFMMAQKIGISLVHSTSSDGRCFMKAMDFLVPYLGKDVSAWPYKQISQWDYKQQELCKDLYKTARYLDSSRKDYLQLFQTNRKLDISDIFYLLYYEPTAEDDAFVTASQQLRYALDCVKKAQNDPQNISQRRYIPRTLKKDGTLGMVGAGDWCSGFFPGSLWMMYDYTHDDFWREEAVSHTWTIEAAKYRTNTHDLGFIVNNSFGKAYEITGERSYRDVVVRASKSLITRFNKSVGCIRSWDHHQDVWKFPVIIDNMMNLEMLFRATQMTGDSIYWKIAVSHANTTMKNHFRDDYSSFHVVDYDPETGAVRTKCTHQGYSDDSFWSRGQGWGLYGYTMCYRFTKDHRYLEQAKNIAQFILNWQLPDDKVCYWDMKCPEIPNTERDASAAALIASALYELSGYVSGNLSAQYIRLADGIVEGLTKHYTAEVGTHEGFLLLHSVGSRPGNSEVDVPLNYADYYYLEALTRKSKLANHK
ncbi:MAG: alginate lyase family protein [Prevotella sp.]|nr:alginate lyase family protein [Prevotella sp.]